MYSESLRIKSDSQWHLVNDNGLLCITGGALDADSSKLKTAAAEFASIDDDTCRVAWAVHDSREYYVIGPSTVESSVFDGELASLEAKDASAQGYNTYYTVDHSCGSLVKAIKNNKLYDIYNRTILKNLRFLIISIAGMLTFLGFTNILPNPVIIIMLPVLLFFSIKSGYSISSTDEKKIDPDNIGSDAVAAVRNLTRTPTNFESTSSVLGEWSSKQDDSKMIVVTDQVMSFIEKAGIKPPNPVVSLSQLDAMHPSSSQPLLLHLKRVRDNEKSFEGKAHFMTVKAGDADSQDTVSDKLEQSFSRLADADNRVFGDGVITESACRRVKVARSALAFGNTSIAKTTIIKMDALTESIEGLKDANELDEIMADIDDLKRLKASRIDEEKVMSKQRIRRA